jgi:hypothetical protein
MVAGRGLRGGNEKRPAQHQTGRGGQLGVEACVDHGLGPGEAGGLHPDLAGRGEVDQQHQRQAGQPEAEDHPAEPSPSPVAEHHQRQRGGNRRHRQQQVEVRCAGGLNVDGGRRRRRQARVAGLPQLDPVVVDELRGGQAGGRPHDCQADPALGGQHPACPHGARDRKVAGPQQQPFEPARHSQHRAQQQDADGSQDPAQSPAPARGDRPGATDPALQPRPGAVQPPVRPGVGPAAPGDELSMRPRGGPPHAPGRGVQAAPRRCYHRPSLRLSC